MSFFTCFTHRFIKVPLRRPSFLSLALLTLTSSTSLASEALIISLHSIPDRIRKQNPELNAARYRIAEARGRLHQSGRKSNPELDIDFGHNADFRERSLTVGISQKFPLTNRLALEKSVSTTALEGAQAEVRDVERRLIAESKQILIKTLAIRRQKALLQQQAKVAEQLASFIGEAAKKGEGSSLDAGQAKLEAAQFINRIRQLDAEAASLAGTLKPLLGMPSTAPLVVSGSLPEIPLPKRSSDTTRRPDLQAARLAVREASESAALERSKCQEDIELSFSGGLERSEDAPEGYDTEAIFSFGVSIPLPFWNKNEGAIQEAEARAMRKSHEAKALDSSIRHEAATAYAEMREWAKLASEITTTLLPLAEQQAKLADQAYREGQGDLQASLRTREQLLELASSRLDALRDFHLAKTRYESALGR
ncbi:TolC family protein [Verrucomicrobiaceae bacterium N1E253]|uniref:TolC family protein n=1 Tax=Oceaniferula marina TaxID=2748318 RepID=A0A851GJE4_9BACT|nr:TolC family protein [Oceaniferula marina]NWK57122.1 TolC family protein [Oceaniferula marina]